MISCGLRRLRLFDRARPLVLVSARVKNGSFWRVLSHKFSGARCTYSLAPSFSRSFQNAATGKSKSYVYRPLGDGEVRLIELHPGKGKDAVKCNIRHVSLKDNPSYEALSYCWGDPTRDFEISCNTALLNVTSNLLLALSHLRHIDRPRTLWVDAISINQDDVDERNTQVLLMRDIFHKSQRTVVWLGEESQNSTAAIHLVRCLARTSQNPLRKGQKCPAWYHGVNNLPPLYSEMWRALSTLLRRPWFYRAWIVQEVAVSRDTEVRCGEDSVSWNELHNAVAYLLDLGIFFMFPEDTTYQMLMIAGTQQQFAKGIKPRLLSLLLRNRSFSATDPRDMVFTLLALADRHDVESLGIEPNYHLTTEQVYKSLAIALLKSRKDLDLFNAPRVLEKSRTKGLPSWAPDWSTSDACVPFGFLGTFGLRDSDGSKPQLDYHAASFSTSSPLFNEDKNILHLAGIKIDRIEATGELFHARYREGVSHMAQLFRQSCEMIELLITWQKVARVRSRDRYATGEKRLDAYWQTVCAGYMPEGYNCARKEFYRWNKFLHPFNFVLKLFGHLFPHHETENWSNWIFFFLFRIGQSLSGVPPSKIPQIGFPPQMVSCNYRRMIRTRKGYIGLAPRYAQTGDWIVVCKGGKAPLVVRSDDKGNYWQLVGESYVHGIMKGEMWDEGRCETLLLK
jgi:hypothetical protein